MDEHFAHLDWPFLDAHHGALARELDAWAAAHIVDDHGADVDGACRTLVAQLGAAGWLRYAVADGALDTRAICIVRETLARHATLADFAFAMQGLGSGAIGLYGSAAQRAAYLPAVAAGTMLAAFALSEPNAGSDVAALQCKAVHDGDTYVLDGEKTWVSNGGIADFYVVFARTGEAPGSRGISAFIVDADTPGLIVAERIALMAPHPMARLRFDACRIPATALLGAPGQGFKMAMATLDVFRSSVAAAALGMARRALAASVAHVLARTLFGQQLADFQLTQAALADMATGIDAAALLTYRAAWARDHTGAARTATTRAAAMAKLHATETAQHVIDAALQLFGGQGVLQGAVTEKLYREIRALRIYEGASEVQRLIVARDIVAAARAGAVA